MTLNGLDEVSDGQSGPLTQVLQGGMSVVAGRGAVAAFDVGAMPDTRVSRPATVPQAGEHVEQVPGVAAQPIDHVLEGPEPRLAATRATKPESRTNAFST
jgi:hypothetical protein